MGCVLTSQCSDNVKCGKANRSLKTYLFAIDKRESLTLLTSYATANWRIQYSRLLTFEQALCRLVAGHAIETIAYIDHHHWMLYTKY